MIQDFKEKFDNQYKPFTPSDDDSVICFCGKDILISLNNGKLKYPSAAEIESVGQYLFTIDDKRYFLGISSAFGEYEYMHYTVLRTAMPGFLAFAGVAAFQLNNWYNDNKFCGRCARHMYHSKTERSMLCSCGNTVYPKISPAVIVGIMSNNRICLTKYNRPNARWSLVAGFNEIGETIEQTVHREVMEETGLKVKNLRYYKSQPWGFTSTLLYGFFCEADGDDTIRIDNDELKAGKWFSAEEIDFDDDGLSLTREMIDKFKRNDV